MGKNLKVEITPETIYGPNWRSLVPSGCSVKRLGMPAPGDSYVNESGEVILHDGDATLKFHRLIVVPCDPQRITLTFDGRRHPRPGEWFRDESGAAIYLSQRGGNVIRAVYKMTTEDTPRAISAGKKKTKKKKIVFTFLGKGQPKAGMWYKDFAHDQMHCAEKDQFVTRELYTREIVEE